MEVQENIGTNDSSGNNPLILGIETSGNACSVALSYGEDILGEYTLLGRSIHDEMLADLIRQLTEDCKVELNKLDAVAVSAGPGSFTGLRIGAAVAKGLCFDNEIKLIPVGTLHSIAYSMRDFAIRSKIYELVVVTRSHSDFYHYQKFDLLKDVSAEVEMVTFADLVQRSQEIDLGLTTDKELTDSISSFIYVPQSAKNICLLGFKFYLKGMSVLSELFVPEYHFEFKPNLKKKSRQISPDLPA